MSIQLAAKVRTLEERVDSLEALVAALKLDLDAAADPGGVAEPGLAIPSFPRVLKELGYESPAGLIEGREVLHSPQLRTPAEPEPAQPADTPEGLAQSVSEFLDA